MTIDRAFLHEHYKLFGLLADAISTLHARSTDANEGMNAMNAVLQGIKSDLTDMNTKLDALIAAKSDQDAADEADIKATIDAMTAKVTAALTPPAAVVQPVAAAVADAPAA